MEDTFRKVYTPLTEQQKYQVDAIKTACEVLEELFNGIVRSDERSEQARCVNIARTKLEEVSMWAVKGVTTKQG